MLSPCTHRYGTILNRDDYEDISHANDGDYDMEDADDDDSKSKLSKGAQSWRNVRAVMAYYCSLRKIKRNGFTNNQSIKLINSKISIYS